MALGLGLGLALGWCATQSASLSGCSAIHCAYGRAAAIIVLSSSSGMMRPWSKSMRNMRPGSRRPLVATAESARSSSTPTWFGLGSGFGLGLGLGLGSGFGFGFGFGFG